MIDSYPHTIHHGFGWLFKEMQEYYGPKMKHESRAGMRNRVSYKLWIFLQVL